MNIRLQNGLPFVVVQLMYGDRQITLENVLLDTGSAGSIFPTDQLLTIGLQYEAEDYVYRVRGVGGTEFVFAKLVDQLALGELQVEGFEIEVGLMDYGFEIDGIIGMDFLTKVGAIVDLERMQVSTRRK